MAGKTKRCRIAYSVKFPAPHWLKHRHKKKKFEKTYRYNGGF